MRAMPGYSGTANRPDRVKAIGAVVAVHAALAAIILTGLNVRVVSQAVERLQTFDFRAPPPPKPPPPQPEAQAAKREAGAPARRAEASPIVAPPPRLPLPSPVPAAKIAGSGSAPGSGAGVSGSGTGAGGSGTGPGGGGMDTSGFTPARLVRNLAQKNYRVVSATRMRNGSVNTHLIISSTGSVTRCNIIRSSGDQRVDSTVCQLILNGLRFSPARDASGQAIEYNTQYLAKWTSF